MHLGGGLFIPHSERRLNMFSVPALFLKDTFVLTFTHINIFLHGLCVRATLSHPLSSGPSVCHTLFG